MPFHLRLAEFKDKQNNDLLCPDKITTCKDDQTCCQFEGDEYGWYLGKINKKSIYL